jgi:DNA-directed RNA polymerase specialized sigma24 family protein
MPVTTQPPPFDRQPPVGDVASLHSRQVARLVAYLSSSDRHAGARDAEDVAGEAFLEVASTWPSIGNASSAEAYLFACAHRIAVTRSHLGRSGQGDALAESMPAFGDQADLARLAVLQDALDQLPAAPRYAVLLREMCGFPPSQAAEIIGLPETTVELARDDALRTLVPVVESGTMAVHARRGPLSPDDFAALSRVLQHPDAERLAQRRRLAERLAGPARFPHGTGPLPTGGVPLGRSTVTSGWDAGRGGFSSPSSPLTGGFDLEPGWSRMTPLDAPLSQVDLSSTSTPIFDAISAWFSSDSSHGDSNSWAALDDRGWREANARAAAAPEVAGMSDAGLPKRRPGANAVPSAAQVGPNTRRLFGEPPRVDPGQVRHRLGGFQQGVNDARRLRGRARDGEAAATAEPERPWDPLFDPMPARRSTDGPRAAVRSESGRGTAPSPASGSVPASTGAAKPASGSRDEGAYRTFQREYLPQLLAALLLGGATPPAAAEIAQEVLDEAYWNWSTLKSPEDWARERALSVLARRQRSAD